MTYNKEMLVIRCESCGKEQKRFPNHVKRNKHNFCNRDCRSDWQRKNQQRENNPNWRGGKYKTERDYVMAYAPEHERANNWGYVYEHILVAEKKYRRSTKGYHVHHLNGVRDDNRPENLIIVKPKDHERNTVRKLMQKRILELEQMLAM